MFKRDIIDHLEAWRRSPRRKPLVLRGPRQVGKTTVVNMFGASFDNYLYLNLEDSEAAGLFELNVPLAELMPFLFAHCKKRRADGSTLIFIDEIQNSARAVSRLRYFYEQLPEVYVIAAGSLLENLVDMKTSFPVGRVQYMALRPCSFREFLVALGEEQLVPVLAEPKVAGAFHDRLMALFSQYLITGGMPECVQAFAETRDFAALDDVFETLLQGYRDDSEKYAREGIVSEAVRFVLKEGWTKAGQIVTLGNFASSSYAAREMGEAFRLLEKAMLLELVYPTSSVDVPALSETRRQPKLVWLDTGLVNYAAQVQTEVLRSHDIMDAWRGMIAEQVVGQQLLTLNDKVSQQRNYWSRGRAESAAEVDFIWVYKSRIYPIEVKAGHNAHLRSLHSFVDRSSNDVAVRVWSQPYSVDDVVTASGKPFRLVNLPFYMVGSLETILDSIG